MYYQTLYSEYVISCQKFHFIVTHRKREASICCAVLFTPTKQAVFFFQLKVIFTQKRSVWPPRSCSCCQDPVGIYCEVSGLQWISPLHTEITCSGDLSTCSCRFVFSFPSQSVRAVFLMDLKLNWYLHFRFLPNGWLMESGASVIEFLLEPR